MDQPAPSWIGAARLLLGARQDEAARAVLDIAARAHPDDVRPLIAQAEIAAMADDYLSCRLAMQALIRHGAGEALTACLTDECEVAFRLAQLWVSVDGRDRRSRFWLARCMERFDWFLPAVPSGLTPEAYAAAVAPGLARRAQDQPHPADSLTLWQDWLDPTDGPEMRGEVLMTQAGAHGAEYWGSVRLLAYYSRAARETRANDHLGLMPAFADDGALGIMRFRLADGAVVTQDQLISAHDLGLLAGWVGCTPADAPLLIDVGAGYGRLTHRFLQAFPSSHALALDAVPGTSALAEYYLGMRGCAGRAITGGPNRLLEPLPPGAPRIAVNIHSWSEAPLASIRGWLDLLNGAAADWLLLATHDIRAVTLEREGPALPMIPAIMAAGWKLIEDRPRFLSLPQNTGHLWLFTRG
jgi:hypothetical protein